jgi:hypothetical protein
MTAISQCGDVSRGGFRRFYQWSGSLGQCELVRLPQNLSSWVAATQALENVSLFSYPKNGQTSAQQATDRIECQRWATGQTGIDASPAGSSVPVIVSPAGRPASITVPM